MTPRTLELKVEELCIADLITAPEYQRSTNTKYVKRIAKELVPKAVGLPLLGKRPSGVYAILDGQQRIEALRLAGYTHVLCSVVAVADIEEEAIIFFTVNAGRTAVQSAIKFKARLAANDLTATRIREAVENADMKLNLTNAQGWPNVGCTFQLEKIFKRGGGLDGGGYDHLVDTLVTVRELWEGSAMATQADVLAGVSLLLQQSPLIDRNELRKKVGVIPIERLMRDAGRFRTSSGSSNAAKAVACAILEIYNKRKTKKNRLVIDFDQ